MAVTHKAPYVQSIDLGIGFVTGGIDIDATTTDVTQTSTGGANGGLCVGARFSPEETTTAGVAWMFLSNDGGSTFRILDQQTVAAATITATSAAGTPIDFTVKGAVISEDNPVRMGASNIIGFGFSTTITPSVGHGFFSEVENF